MKKKQTDAGPSARHPPRRRWILTTLLKDNELNVPPLILGSTSPYRKALMERLGLSFVIERPPYDEVPLQMKALKDGTMPADLAMALAIGKAESLRSQHPEAVIIGSDQVGVLHLAELGKRPFELLHKPGNRENNIVQLTKLSNRVHSLFSAVSILSPGRAFNFVHETQIEFRKLSQTEIESVVDQDQAFDCAGGYKFEKAGVRFISALRCSDPTAIEGLPLIQVSTVLRELGYF